MGKTYTPTPESELTEQEVRKWFNRLRELYQEALHRIHELKVDRGKLRVDVERLNHEVRVLTREKQLRERKSFNMGKSMAPKKIKAKLEVVEFKKKFLDNL